MDANSAQAQDSLGTPSAFRITHEALVAHVVAGAARVLTGGRSTVGTDSENSFDWTIDADHQAHEAQVSRSHQQG